MRHGCSKANATSESSDAVARFYKGTANSTQYEFEDLVHMRGRKEFLQSRVNLFCRAWKCAVAGSVFSLFFLASRTADGQPPTTSPPSNPQALQLASKGDRRLSRPPSGQGHHHDWGCNLVRWGARIWNCYLQGAWYGRKPNGLSSLPDGTRTEIRDASTGISQGKWIALDGTSGMYALHNAMTDAVWFYSALGALAVGPNVVLSFVGLEYRNRQEVQRLPRSTFSRSRSRPALVRQSRI